MGRVRPLANGWSRRFAGLNAWLGFSRVVGALSVSCSSNRRGFGACGGLVLPGLPVFVGPVGWVLSGFLCEEGMGV
jgi:hypothetical protein